MPVAQSAQRRRHSDRTAPAADRAAAVSVRTSSLRYQRRHQPRRRQGLRITCAGVSDLGAGQARRFAPPRPRHQQRHEGLQHSRQLAPAGRARRARTRSAGHDRARTVRRSGRCRPRVAGAADRPARVRDALHGSFHAQLAQCLRAVGPVLAHLHPQVQVQRAGRAAAFSSCRAWRADALQAFAARRRSRWVSGPRDPPRSPQRRPAGPLPRSCASISTAMP